jgi:uncharacterized delta-60 repeat protein
MAFLAACVLTSAQCLAAEGDLDPTFGSGGRVTTDVGSDAFQEGTAIDPEGRILVLGQARAANNVDTHMLVCRYLPNGTLDSSFDGDGIATFDFPAAGSDSADAATVDAQGRILVLGVTEGAGQDFGLIRLNPDGSRDTTFGPGGSNGFVTKDFSGSDEFPAAVSVDSQGRIVVAGTARVGGDFDFAVARYDSNGLIDTTFSDDGQQTVDFTPLGNDQDLALGMVIDSQGRIVLAGRTQQPSLYDFALARLNSDGSRDATFGSNADPNEKGEVTTPIGDSSDAANAVALDAQGRIIAAGSAVVGTREQFALARYNPDGSLDTTFSGDGKQTTPIGTAGDGDSADFVGVDSDGRIAIAGDANINADERSALVRYTPDGELDPTFGAGGMVTQQDGQMRSGLVDAQDRIVLGATFPAGAGGHAQVGLTRFIGDAVAPSATINSGPADGALINDATPTFEFSTDDPDALLACGFDGASSGCSSPFTPTTPLADGEHTFGVSATDLAGNSSAASRTFTVDTTPPEITIKGKRNVKTDDEKAKTKLKIKTSERAELTCKIDKKKPKPCDKRFKTPKLKLGKHKVKVTATDQAGNSSDEKKKLKVVEKKP